MIPLKLKRLVKGSYLAWRDFGPRVAMAHARMVWTNDSPESIRHRYTVTLAYLEQQYGDLLAQYRARQESTQCPEDAPIWTMWWDGELPGIIQLCHRSKLRHAGTHPVHLLTRHNIREYISFPESVWSRFESGKLRIQHLADMIRVQLLRKYGGLWLDASVFCAGPIPEDWFSRPLYSIRSAPDPQYVSNNQWTTFALGGWPGNILCSFLDDFFQEYCRRGKPFMDYYLLDCAIALAHRHIPAVREALEALPREKTDIYWLDRHMDRAADGLEVSALPRFSKLNWRRFTHAAPGSLYDTLLAEYGLRNRTVSIIIPVWNVQEYLPQCLDSLLVQSYVNWQAILVDDGSADASGRICDEYARKDARFQVIHQANAGAANARNSGLDHASGTYLTFLDSDDWVAPDWLQTLVDAAAAEQADVVECDFVSEYTDGPRKETAWADARFTAEEYLAQYPSNWKCSLVWNKLYRADLLKGVRFPARRRCIDDEFFTYRAVAGAGRITRVSNALYHYRQRRSGAVSHPGNRLQKTADALEVLPERYHWIRQNFPRLGPIYRRHDVDILFYFAGAMDFTEETVELFRKTAGFYLRESLLHPFEGLLPAALRLQAISPKTLLERKKTLQVYAHGKYFP